MSEDRRGRSPRGEGFSDRRQGGDGAGYRGSERPGRRGSAGSDRRDRGSSERRGGGRSGERRGAAGAGEARRDRPGSERPSGTGPRLAPKTPRLPEPAIPEDVTGKELDRSVHHQLRTLSKENADGVAKHLVMVAAYLAADELDAALAHAETAVRRAGRVAVAREALGMVAYRRGDFGRALTEFRTVRRLGGSNHLLPLMVDCERGLGRHERALELAASPEARTLEPADRAELAIVVAGVRRDLGQHEAALLTLRAQARARGPHAYRVQYAYADLLLESGDVGQAREWFARAATGDLEGETDATERLEEIDGVVVEDLAPEAESAPDAELAGVEGPELLP